MHVLRRISILLRRGDAHVLLAVLGGLLAGGALAASPYQISQKNREFQPGYIAINRGDALRYQRRWRSSSPRLSHLPNVLVRFERSEAG